MNKKILTLEDMCKMKLSKCGYFAGLEIYANSVDGYLLERIKEDRYRVYLHYKINKK